MRNGCAPRLRTLVYCVHKFLTYPCLCRGVACSGTRLQRSLPISSAPRAFLRKHRFCPYPGDHESLTRDIYSHVGAAWDASGGICWDSSRQPTRSVFTWRRRGSRKRAPQRTAWAILRSCHVLRGEGGAGRSAVSGGISGQVPESCFDFAHRALLTGTEQVLAYNLCCWQQKSRWASQAIPWHRPDHAIRLT